MVLLVAYATMLIDHIGWIFFPTEIWWRIVWRVAFPLFAWWIVRGYRLTSNKSRYAKRILILGIISQIPLLFLLPILLINICFTLLFWLIALAIWDTKKLHLLLKISFISILCAIAWYFNFDYWAYGVLLILLFHIFWQQKMTLIYMLILTYAFYGTGILKNSFPFDVQMYALISVILLYFTPIQKYDFRLNFYFKYGFYPIHLFILYSIFLLLS